MKETFEIGKKSINAGKTVKVISGAYEGEKYRIEDWWYTLTGKSWMFSDGNAACIEFAIRSGSELKLLTHDDNVYYGKIGGYGKLMHISDLELPDYPLDISC